MRSKYGDSENTPKRVKELYTYITDETGIIEEELDKREPRYKDIEGNSDEIVILGFDDEDDEEITTAPKAKFVTNNDEKFGDILDENYDIALKETAEIEKRLSNLKDFNKSVAENQIKRVKLLNKEIKQLYKKELGTDKVSKEIADRSFVTDNNSIFFKPIGVKGEYLAKKLILKKGKVTDFVFSEAKNSENAVKQFKELVSKLPDMKEPVTVEEEPLEKFFIDTDETADSFVFINGLTDEENREQRGVVDPSESMYPESRVGG